MATLSNLAEKKCINTLVQFVYGKINGPELYIEIVKKLEAAQRYIPERRSLKARRHNLTTWKERMQTFRERVDFWLQWQYL